MGLGREESSFDHTRRSHSSGCDRVSHNRATRANAEAYWAAIATLVVMQSTLGATLTLSIERIVATPVGASVGALEANYFGANLVRVRDCDLSRRIALDRVPFGEDRVSLRERYPHHHRSNSALGCTVEYRTAQIHRSLSRNHRRSRGRGSVAGKPTAFTQ